MNMVVVDDELPARNYLLHVLSEVDREGGRTGLHSGEEALSYLEQKPADVIFLDIEMPGISGLELARRVKEIRPETNIVFVTGFSEYALEAHALYVSGFLLKPATKEMVQEALRHLRYPSGKSRARLRVQCFGSFEVFVDGRPLLFRRSKTKELFAYLVDRRGANCTMGELVAVLWEDKPDSGSQRNQLRNLISDLRRCLREAGAEDVIVKRWNSISVDCDKMDCDYYRFLRMEPVSLNSYTGEYMEQYSWAELTTGLLSKRKVYWNGN